jgi:hypothetical protein
MRNLFSVGPTDRRLGTTTTTTTTRRGEREEDEEEDEANERKLDGWVLSEQILFLRVKDCHEFFVRSIATHYSLLFLFCDFAIGFHGFGLVLSIAAAAAAKKHQGLLSDSLAHRPCK